MRPNQRTALYRYFDGCDRLLYVGISHCWASRAVQHRHTAKWFADVARVETEWFSTRQAANEAETRAIQSENPAHNVAKRKSGLTRACAFGSRYPNTRSAKTVMLCWNANSDQVGLVDWPDHNRSSNRYDASTLACNSNVHEMTPEQLTAQCFIEAMHLIVRDGCDPQAVHRALCGVSEYQDGLSNDVPGAIEPEAA
jgi:hypothetical protein